MKRFCGICFVAFCFFGLVPLMGYHLPPLNLGFTSFLDGIVGKVKPGMYFQEYLQYYESDRFLDNNGKKIPPLEDPDFSTYVSLSQWIYVSDIELFKGKLAFDVLVPYVFSSHLNHNPIDLRTNGGGWSNLVFGPAIIWDTIMNGEQPVMTNMVEFDFSVPSGKYNEPKYGINPGFAFWYFQPFWASILFITPKLSLSWRLHYLWCGRDYKTHIQAGQSIYANYALGYQVRKDLILGINGYFLEQLQDSKFYNQRIPHSRERVFSIGPGFAYLPSETLAFFGNLYLESCVKNRPEGTRVNIRMAKFF